MSNLVNTSNYKIVMQLTSDDEARFIASVHFQNDSFLECCPVKH